MTYQSAIILRAIDLDLYFISFTSEPSCSLLYKVFGSTLCPPFWKDCYKGEQSGTKSMLTNDAGSFT